MPIHQALTHIGRPATPQELELFIDWVLSDRAERRVGKGGERQPRKRGNRPMQGIYVSRQGSTGLRGSDIRERRYVCIRALRWWGDAMSEDRAVSTLAQKMIGPGVSLEKIDSFRTGFYEHEQKLQKRGWLGDTYPPTKDPVLEEYWGSFCRWMEWVLQQHARDRQAPRRDGRTWLGRVEEIFREEWGEAAANMLRELCERALSVAGR